MRDDIKAVYTAADYGKEVEKLRAKFKSLGIKNACIKNSNNMPVYFWQLEYNMPVKTYGYLLVVTDGKKYGLVSLVTLCLVRAGFNKIPELLKYEGISA